MALGQPFWSSARLTTGLVLAFWRIQAATPVDQLIERLQQHYNSAQTLFLRFTESYSVQGHARPAEAGTLTLRKQGKMRWDYTQPAGKVFISDGRNAFLYTAGDNRIEKIPLKDTEDMRAPLAFLLGHLDLKKDFRDIHAQAAGENKTWLRASAKNDRLPYSQINMLVEPDGRVDQLQIDERDGSQLAFAFSGEQRNPAVADKIFHFEVPPGAEVVDAVGSGAQEK